MAKAGRPRKLTPQVIEKYCQARSIGSCVEVAALYAGVSDTAVDNWIKRGKELRQALEEENKPIPRADRIFVTFLEQVEEADGNAAITWQQVVDKAGAIDPNWAWRLLRQRFPKGYSEPTLPPQTVVNVGLQISADDMAKALDQAKAFEDSFIDSEGPAPAAQEKDGSA